MIGIIGTGWGTRVQVPAFRAAGLPVVALAARNKEKTKQQARDLGIPFATSDWRELLARPDVQLVSIVTPPATHRELAIAALEAGKHVLCEKPMALDAVETQQMVDAARAHSTQYALIDHELRFLPSLQHARSLAQGGTLGKLRHIESTVIGGGRGDPQRPWNWWSDAEQGGGLLGAIGSHQVDTLQWLFGPVRAVNALVHTFITERPSDTGARPVTADDYSALLLRFGDNALASVTMSVVGATNEPNRLTAHFDRGALRIEAGRLLLWRDGAWQDTTPPDSLPVPDDLRNGGEFQRGTVYLAAALKRTLHGDCTAIAPAATWNDGHMTQRVLDAARHSSANSGSWITLNE